MISILWSFYPPIHLHSWISSPNAVFALFFCRRGGGKLKINRTATNSNRFYTDIDISFYSLKFLTDSIIPNSISVMFLSKRMGEGWMDLEIQKHCHRCISQTERNSCLWALGNSESELIRFNSWSILSVDDWGKRWSTCRILSILNQIDHRFLFENNFYNYYWS